MSYITKQAQPDPQEHEAYNTYVAATSIALILADPKVSPEQLARRAHIMASEIVFAQRKRDEIYDYGYTNLY